MARGFWHWYEKANDIVRFFTGPAQIGAGYVEAPETRSADAACPLCGKPMSGHTVIRSEGQYAPTRLTCP